MSGIMRDCIQSLKLKDPDAAGFTKVDMKLLERIISIPDADTMSCRRRDRTRKITLVGKYPKYPNINLSQLQKYDPTDRIWKESHHDPDTGSQRRRSEFPSLSTEFSGGRLSHQMSQVSTDSDRPVFNRPLPLRLPPIILPPLYTVKPTPLLPRDFSSPPPPRGPITEEEWEDLRECRYLRPGLKKFRHSVIS